MYSVINSARVGLVFILLLGGLWACGTELEEANDGLSTTDGVADASDSTSDADDTTDTTGNTDPTDDTNTAGTEAFELIGEWASAWAEESITEDRWGAARIVTYDNDANVAIIQMPDDDEYNPSQFSKLVWTDIVEDTFHYCTVAYGQETEAAAQQAEDIADSTDLDGAGCGGFPWSALKPALEIRGSWASEWGSESISSHMWQTAAVVEYDNEANVALTQMPPDDEYNPNQFSKLVWTEVEAGAFYYCTVAYGQETLEDARGAEDTADRDDLDGAGCGGFPWTELSPEDTMCGR